jgi:acetylglutamate kinase
VHGPLAVGLSGEDAGLITCHRPQPDARLRRRRHAVNPTILERLLAEDLIPVVSTIGADAKGQAYNINADTVAGAIAEALGPRSSCTSPTSRACGDVDDPASLIRQPRPPSSAA